MRLNRALCTGLVAAALCAGAASAQTIITYETRSEAGSVAGVAVDPNITGGSLSRGSGVTQNTGSTYNSAGWEDGADLAGAIAANNYYAFTINVLSGAQATIDLIQIRYDRSSTGPAQLAILSSVTGFTAVAAPVFTDNSVSASGEAADILVSGHAGLSGTIEFRIYAWGATGSAGTFDIEVYPSTSGGPGIGIIVNGSTMGGGGMTGACCDANGLCTITMSGNCGGVYQGDGSSCSPNPCPQVIGSCCVSGTCVVDTDMNSCLANPDSFWGGAGTTCASYMCPAATGSCCVGAMCTAGVSQAQCSGVFTAGGTCAPNLCDDGACCNPAYGSCFLAFDQAACDAVSGAFFPGTTCLPSPCTPVAGACCTGGNCTLTTDGLACRGGGGAFLGVGTTCGPTTCDRATGTNLVAKYDFDVNVVGGGSRNLGFMTSVNPPFPTGDYFGVAQRYVDAGLPFGLLDDSVFLFNNDTLGIIPESKVDSWFGVVDLFDQIVPNNPGTATATWMFDVNGFENLSVTIDVAAMGDFETAAGCSQPPCIDDFFRIDVSLDGSTPVTVMVSAADDNGTQSYTLADGFVVDLADPQIVTGPGIAPTTLSNVFQTITGAIAGTGSTLTVTLTAFGDGADEGYAFDNLMIMGSPIGATDGACCQPGGACTQTTPALCALANGTFQGLGSTCSPNPCAPATGACCCGSSCTITTAAACTGANRSFAGAGTSCTPFSSTVPCCRGDYNKSGAPATVQDIFDFLSGYFSNDACADSNDSGGNPTVQDIFDFLSAYFGGGC